MKNFCLIVVAVCLTCIVFSCKKANNHPDHSAKMVGVRHWEGINIYSAYWVPAGPPLYADTGRRLIDTSFAIKTEGSDVVIILGHRLNYTREDRVVKAVIYEYPKKTPVDEMQVELVYYYEQDSMTYNYNNWHHSYGSATILNTKR